MIPSLVTGDSQFQIGVYNLLQYPQHQLLQLENIALWYETFNRTKVIYVVSL